MDSALLSKIERGQRLPTEEQTAAFAKYFGANLTTWESMRIAERILHEHGHNPEAAALALVRIQENAASHPVNRKRVAVNYRRKPVQKSKKKA